MLISSLIFSFGLNVTNILESFLLIAAGAEIIDNPTVRDTNLISATSGETGISDLLEMLAQAINDNSQN